MGLGLEFIIGDPEAIRLALENEQLDNLDDPAVIAKAVDFSLHIIPRDLDLLSQSFGMQTGRPPLDLRSHLEVWVDSADGGLLHVAPEWVRYVADTPESRALDVVLLWFERMQQEHWEPSLTVTEDAIEAVRELIELCREAAAQEKQVLHLWNA